MKLPLAYAEGMTAAMKKFAVSGAMYARALQGAAQRGGGRVAPQIMSQVAAQPRAAASPFLSGTARTPGALAPTQQQRGLQGMMSQVPWAGAEHGGDPRAAQHFNQALQQHGLVSQGAGGTPMNQQIVNAFGPTPGQSAAYANTHVEQPNTIAGSRRRGAVLPTANTVSMRVPA